MKPFMMYIIGISGSGKTTIATRLTDELRKRNVDNLQFIDGDVIREELTGIFGYTYEERMKNNRVVCVVCDYLLRNNINVILAQVAGHQAMRDQVKNNTCGDYIEVYAKCSLEECESRDVKGYYRKVKEGQMENLNGANTDFEIPKASDIVIDTERLTVDESVDLIMRLLVDRGYI